MALVDRFRDDVVTTSPDERVSVIARMMDERNVGSAVFERDGVARILASETNCVADSIRESSAR